MELWNHANGIDESVISDWKEMPKEKSFSHSQVLFKDYNASNIRLIINEMCEVICRRLRVSKKECISVGLGIGYSKSIGGGFYHHVKLSNSTDSEKEVLDNLILIFDKYYENQPIRKVSICLGGLTDKKATQLNLFENIEDKELDDSFHHTIDEIKNKYGKNSILKASSLLSDSTIIERNGKIGGHNAG